MPMSTDREKAILDVAQDMVRQGGYNGFSFRTIASAIGIKSSSVHYHFSTKEDLGAAVAEYYTDNFIEALGSPKSLMDSNLDPLDVYIQAFRTALLDDKGMCLCGILSAEREALPEQVVAAMKMFFTRNIEWLQAAFTESNVVGNVHEKAIQTIAVLEGAMITSKALEDVSAFDSAAKILKNSI